MCKVLCTKSMCKVLCAKSMCKVFCTKSEKLPSYLHCCIIYNLWGTLSDTFSFVSGDGISLGNSTSFQIHLLFCYLWISPPIHSLSSLWLYSLHSQGATLLAVAPPPSAPPTTLPPGATTPCLAAHRPSTPAPPPQRRKTSSGKVTLLCPPVWLLYMTRAASAKPCDTQQRAILHLVA